MSRDSIIVQQAIMEAVENQLRDNDPKITQETYARLKSGGFSSEEAKKLICYALANEISEIMDKKEPFNEERYTQNLNNLPDIPWEE